MDLHLVGEELAKVSDIYARKFAINRDDDWFILKIQEELGELSSAYLKLTQRARVEGQGVEALEKNLRDEVADVIAMTMLFARRRGIDLEKALKEKWFQYL